MRKKFFMIGFLFIFFAAFSYPQSINIMSPRSGQTWYKGSRYTITWNHSGNMNANVKIRLYQGNRKILGITDSAPNNGSFSWQIPDNIAPGEYKIRVKTVDNQVFDDSDNFRISNPEINVTKPRRGEVWHNGETHLIKWERQGNMNANVKIRLYQGDRKILGIIDSMPNNRQYPWRIPWGLPEGIYRIRVKTVDNKVYDDSDDFKIERKRRSLGGLTVKFPNGGERLLIGTYYEVLWNPGNINGNVSIELYKGDNYYGSLIQTTQNTGKRSVFTSFVFNNGRSREIKEGDDYKIKIKSLFYPNIYDFSDDNFSFEFPVYFDFPPPKRVVTLYTGDKVTFKWRIRRDNMPRLSGGVDFRVDIVSPIYKTVFLKRQLYITTTSFTWRVPNNIREGYYKVILYLWAAGGGVVGESNKFQIKKRWKK